MTARLSPKISLITPNYNGADYLSECLDSVVNQDYEALEFVVVDGASTDGSRFIINQYEPWISDYVCEPDEGHADALNKGFARTSGEIMGWINSDDILLPHCLEKVAAVFEAYPHIEWITGRASTINSSGVINHVSDVRSWSRLRFLCGDHRWIQQESTFWRRSLWTRAGAQMDTSLNLANDFELWARFFRHAPLYSLDQMLGGFRIRDGQRSVSFRSTYEAEVDAVLKRELELLEPTWRQTYPGLIPAKPRTLNPGELAQLEPSLRKCDPPVLQIEGVDQAKPLPPGGPNFSGNALSPEPKSDLKPLKNKHLNERCFILGNGPSLNETDLELLEGETVFACNAAFLLFDRINWRPTYYTCVDTRVLPDRAAEIVSMLDQHPDMIAFFPAELQEHGGSRYRTATRQLIPDGPGRFFFNEVPGDATNLPWSQFSIDADVGVIQPHTVAITMLQLAAYMGFSEIILVGCDTRYTIPEDIQREDASNAADLRIKSTSFDPNHFDTSYFGAGRDWHMPNVNLMLEHYRIARNALERLGVEVRNATVGGDLDVFDRVQLERAVKGDLALGSRQKPVSQMPSLSLRAKSRNRLLAGQVGAVLSNNKLPALGVIALTFGALIAAVSLPELRIWIALGYSACALMLMIMTLAVKVRRIIFQMNRQLESLQRRNARLELNLQRNQDIARGKRREN